MSVGAAAAGPCVKNAKCFFKLGKYKGKLYLFKLFVT